MLLLKNRRERESIIVQTMIAMYCSANHGGNETLCLSCKLVSGYSSKRLLSCMFGELKPVCKECPVHCYSPQMREQIRQIMQWAGPKMVFRKPIYAFIHLIDRLFEKRISKEGARFYNAKKMNS